MGLTKDAEYMLCALYASYKAALIKGIYRERAKVFPGAEFFKKHLLQEWSMEDIEKAGRELEQEGYLICFHLNDKTSECVITDKAIGRIECRFESGLEEVLRFMGELKQFAFSNRQPDCLQ